MLRGKLRFLSGLFYLLLATATAATASDVNYLTPTVRGVQANVIVVNLASHQYYVRPITADQTRARHGRQDTFSAMIKATHALAAINGTYFDCGTLRTLGSMVEDGRLVYDGYIGNAIAVDDNGRACFLKVNRQNGRDLNWKPYRFAICSGPTLVYDHEIALNPWAEGFKDPHVYAAATRSAIGLTSDHRLLLVTVHRPVSLSRLAGMMQSLGAEYALNLDGGSSSAMYFHGSMITRPHRGLTNILTICRVRPVAVSTRHRELDTPTSGELISSRRTNADWQ